jgi:hypothetical protein
MHEIKLFEKFSDPEFKHDFNFKFGGENDDFYAEVNLNDRLIRVEMPIEKGYDTESWYDPKKAIEALVNGKNGHLIEHLNAHLADCYENHTIPEHILIDDDEPIMKVNDNTFLAKLKIKKESYNSWIIKTRGRNWGSRAGKKFGI